MSPEAPLTRSLTAVLARSLEQQSGLRLIIATRGPVLTGPDSNAYQYVIIEGVQIKVPILRGITIGAEGDCAYLLATPDFMIMIGTVKR